MAASGQHPNELPEVLEFLVGDEIIGIRGGVLFRASSDVLPAGGGGGGVTVVQVIEDDAATVPSSAVLFNLDLDFTTALSNKAELDSPVFTGTPTAPTPDSNDDSTALATTKFVHDVVNAKVAGLLDDRGNYNPTATSAYPTAANNGSGTAGAILKGDLWAISADGTMGGITVTIGDTVRALVDAPAQTASNWAIIQNNITYVPENVTNKSTDAELGSSNTLYPTQKAVKDYVTANALTIANSRYQFVSDAGTTYTVPASAVTANGNTIIELSNNSLTSITVNTSTATGKTAGDSVTIQITGTYAAQLLVADGVTLNGTLAFSANAKIKTLIYRGSNTWTVLGG